MEEIYVNYKEMEMVEEQIRDCSSNIQSDCSKLNDYLGEISRVWTGSAANTFLSSIEKCIETFEKTSNMLEVDAETLLLSKKTYEKFEYHFINRKI